MRRRRLFVLVDRRGRPVPAASPAPFDGETKAEAEKEARLTVGPLRRRGWRLVPLSPRLRRALRRMAAEQGLR